MTTVDIIIIALIVLFGIIGLFKGFVGQLVAIGGWLVGAICCVMFSGKVSNWMINKDVFSLNTTITEKVTTWLNGKGGVFTTAVPAGSDTGTVIQTALGELGLPEFLTNLIFGKTETAVITDTQTITEILSPWIVDACISIVATVAIFLIAVIVFAILGAILKRILGKTLKPVDKILGLVLGVGKVALFIWLAMLILSVAGGLVPSIEEFVLKNLQTDGASFSIGRWMYENNPLLPLIRKALE